MILSGSIKLGFIGYGKLALLIEYMLMD